MYSQVTFSTNAYFTLETRSLSLVPFVGFAASQCKWFMCDFCATDMKEIENAVRSITADGLLWGACKFCTVCVYSRPELYLSEPSIIRTTKLTIFIAFVVCIK